MNKEVESAFNVVSQVCGEFSGNLKDHQNIQHALMTIKKDLEKPKKEEEKEPLKKVK